MHACDVGVVLKLVRVPFQNSEQVSAQNMGGSSKNFTEDEVVLSTPCSVSASLESNNHR